MRSFLPLPIALLLLLGGGGLLAAEPPGAYFKNEAWGYKVKVPREWRQAAISADEKWIASKHLGKRRYEAVKSVYAYEEPEMWVVGFPHIRTEQEGVKEITNPYADYREFAERHRDFLEWRGGGYHFAKEEEAKVGGAKVTKYVIAAAEKKKHAPRLVVTWVYHFDDIDFAVQFKILEEFYDDYAASFRGCLKSFRRIERKKAIPGSSSAGAVNTELPVDLDKLSPEERKLALKDAVERKFQREIEALPDGWKHRKSKHFITLYNANEEFTRETIAHAEAVRAHYEKLFGGMGNEYVPPVLLRILATEGEREAYANRTDEEEGLVKEILVVFGHGYVRDNEFEALNKAIFSQWLNYRNRYLEKTMPKWISEGLGKYIGMLRSKGRKIRFSNEDWDRDWIREAIRNGTYMPMLQLVAEEVPDIEPVEPWKALETHDRERQERGVVFWLMRKGNRGKYKNLISRYLDHLAFALEEVEAEVEKEQEERERAAAEAEKQIKREGASDSSGDHEVGALVSVMDRRAEILRKAHDRTFAKWTAKDWKRFTQAWVSYAK
ncbi:MAG: hypothetical protein ACYTGV_01750 [Planctomycetota bacterium]